jgi:8-oxo-dGTP pyrophosphatase MutT (NUDIX family)
MELGESAEDTARRELREEAGLVVGNLELVGVYSVPDQFITAANGDEVYSVTIAYCSRDVTGELEIDLEESLGFEYVNPVERYNELVGSHRIIVDQYLEKHGRA